MNTRSSLFSFLPTLALAAGLAFAPGASASDIEPLHIRGIQSNFGVPVGPAREKTFAPTAHEEGRVDILVVVPPSQSSLGQTHFHFTLPRGVFFRDAWLPDGTRTRGIAFQHHSGRHAYLAVRVEDEWVLEPGVAIVWEGGTQAHVVVQVQGDAFPRAGNSARADRFARLHAR